MSAVTIRAYFHVDSKTLPKYILATLYDKHSDMLRTISRFLGYPAEKDRIATCLWNPRCGIQSAGRMVFCKEHWSLETAVHECVHAAEFYTKLHNKRYWHACSKLDYDKLCEANSEMMADIASALTEQIKTLPCLRNKSQRTS